MVRYSDAQFYKIGLVFEWLSGHFGFSHSKIGQSGPVFEWLKTKWWSFSFGPSKTGPICPVFKW
jgi:hypothetical protein